MVGVHDARHARASCRQPPERTGLRAVRVHHVNVISKYEGEPVQGPQLIPRRDLRAQAGHQPHLESRIGRLVQEAVTAAGDDAHPKAVRVQCLGATQRDRARAGLEAGHHRGDVQPCSHNATRSGAPSSSTRLGHGRSPSVTSTAGSRAKVLATSAIRGQAGPRPVASASVPAKAQ